MTAVRTEHLSKTYPTFALQDVSFALEEGRIAGFVGRNGAGKTTTLKSMLGLVHPDAGEVYYFGLPFRGRDAEIRQRIGYSSGTVSYYMKKKIRDIVAVTRDFYDRWDETAYERYRQLFRIEENKTPSELSEGMKVKLNLLLALSHRAELLLLDEPTSGLDPFSRDELLEVFRTLKNDGVAILFSTHILSDLEKCADDILYIRQGRIEAAAPREEFMAAFGRPGETLEDAILRRERSAKERPGRIIPLYLTPAAAGYTSPALGEDYEEYPVSADCTADFAVRIDGDSMEPVIRDGSVVMVQRSPIENGDVGIFFIDGDMKCKQYCRDSYGNVYLFSINRARSDADVHVLSGSGLTLCCFGKVLLGRRPPLPVR